MVGVVKSIPRIFVGLKDDNDDDDDGDCGSVMAMESRVPGERIQS